MGCQLKGIGHVRIIGNSIKNILKVALLKISKGKGTILLYMKKLKRKGVSKTSILLKY